MGIRPDLGSAEPSEPRLRATYLALFRWFVQLRNLEVEPNKPS
jgi:hypothetical protein